MMLHIFPVSEKTNFVGTCDCARGNCTNVVPIKEMIRVTWLNYGTWHSSLFCCYECALSVISETSLPQA